MDSTASSAPSASGIRDLLWPIYGREHRIWFPMALLIGFILFNYTVARNIKDSLVVTATGGAAVLPFLKLGLVLPASVIFFLIFAKLAELLNRRTLFYVVVLGFLGFFLFFAFVLYPMHNLLHPSESADALELLLPSGLRGLVDCYRVWTFASFYVASELWGVVVAALMFWQFANEVIDIKNAKRFYPHFYLLANVFVAISGLVVSHISTTERPSDIDDWGRTISELTLVITAVGILILVTYAYLDRVVFGRHQTLASRHPLKEKLNLSMGESIKHVLRSPYLGLIALLLISYGVTANLLELTWKRQLGLLFTKGTEYSSFMGHLSTATGIGTIVWIFFGSIILRKKSWRFAALMTPVAMGSLGIIFFLGVLFPKSLTLLSIAFTCTPLLVTVMIGFVLEVLIKSIKYALFDPTKEMAFIPLDAESRLRGKAAVDVIASRAGKSGGGLLEIATITLMGSLGEAIGIFAVFFIIFSGIWILGIHALNARFLLACDK